MNLRNERQSSSRSLEVEHTSESDLPAQYLLDGRYRIIRKLGRGGTGQVYEAVDVKLERRVAVKVLNPDREALADPRTRFEREARAMAQISHENVAQLFDLGVAPAGRLYLILEYLEGQDMRSLLRIEGPLAPPRAVRLIHDACLGLSEAHAKGIIHRDLKPENLFVSKRADGSEKCTVLDFGLAKLQLGSDGEFHTHAGVPFGTPHYMSPEQARGDECINERTDVYSCAAVLYELLCGQRLHQAETAHALLHKITHEAPERLELKGVPLPANLADIVHDALSADATRRPANATRFAQQLRPFLAYSEQLRWYELEVSGQSTQDTRFQSSPKDVETRWFVVLRTKALLLMSVVAIASLLVISAIKIYFAQIFSEPQSMYRAIQDMKYLARADKTMIPVVTAHSVPASPVVATSSSLISNEEPLVSELPASVRRVPITRAPKSRIQVSVDVSKKFDRRNPYEIDAVPPHPSTDN